MEESEEEVKIIKDGKLLENRKWEGTCTACGCIAEAQEKELKITSDQREGDFGETSCPTCKRRMIFYPMEK